MDGYELSADFSVGESLLPCNRFCAEAYSNSDGGHNCSVGRGVSIAIFRTGESRSLNRRLSHEAPEIIKARVTTAAETTKEKQAARRALKCYAPAPDACFDNFRRALSALRRSRDFSPTRKALQVQETFAVSV